MVPSALIFDLDGTLVDSAPDFLNALNRLGAEVGFAPFRLEEVRQMMGYGVRVLLEHALQKRGGVPHGHEPESLARRMIALYFEYHLEASRLFPEVRPTLERLKGEGHRLGLCTNKPHAAALQTLEGLGLGHLFEAVVGGGETPAMKPDPAHVLAVIERLGADIAGSVLIGDTETDIAAARAAGIAVILVRYGYSRIPHARLAPDRFIDHFTALPQALAAMGHGRNPGFRD